MRKNIIKIGAMALTVSMMLTPVSNVFAEGESQRTEVVASNTHEEELSVTNGESENEARGLFTTAYVVTATELNVRSGPGTSYSRIGTLRQGQTVYVYNGSLSAGWVKIKFAGSTGYVYAEYITKI